MFSVSNDRGKIPGHSPADTITSLKWAHLKSIQEFSALHILSVELSADKCTICILDPNNKSSVFISPVCAESFILELLLKTPIKSVQTIRVVKRVKWVFTQNNY